MDYMDKAMQVHAMGLIEPGDYWGGLLDYPGYLVSETGMSHRELAKRFGVATMTAYRADVGQSWAEVKP